MNFALPTLTLLFLLTPGLIFRRFYYTGEFSEEYFKATFSDLLTSTIIPSIFINFLAYCCVMKWYVLNTSTFSVLISGTDDADQINTALNSIYNFKGQLLLYLLLTCFLGAVFGIVTKYLVRKHKIDRRHQMFRFSNQWHYLFTAEILDFPGFRGLTDQVEIRYLDVLVDTAAGSIIYSGSLEHYILNKQGGIDSIYLSEVKRRYLNDDETVSKESSYYFLPGEFFIIPFNQIKNLHITYYAVETNQQIEQKVNNLDPSIIE